MDNGIISETIGHHNISESWYTVSQAAAILGISKREVRKRYLYTVIDGVKLFHAQDLGYFPKTKGM